MPGGIKGRQKWAIAVPFIAAFSLGLPALAAGGLWWFVGSWTDCVFVLFVAVMWTGGTLFYRPERRKRPPSLTRVLFSLGLLLVIPVSVYERTHGPAASRAVGWSWLGLALGVTGAAVGISAWRALGASYVPDPDILPGQKLVTSGMYRYLRHPMYTAALLWVAGFPLLVRSFWGVAVGLLSIGPTVWLRVREEEALLLEAFEDEYRAYQARTWRLFPFVF